MALRTPACSGSLRGPRTLCQMKRAAERLGLEQAPPGTQAQLGTVRVKLPLWASLLPASRRRCEARALQAVFCAAVSTLVEGSKAEAKSQPLSPAPLGICPPAACCCGLLLRPARRETMPGQGRRRRAGGNSWVATGEPGLGTGREEKEEDCPFLKLLERIRVGLSSDKQARSGCPATVVQVPPYQGWQILATGMDGPLSFHTHSRFYPLNTALGLFGFMVLFRQPSPINQCWHVRGTHLSSFLKTPKHICAGGGNRIKLC